jgi:phosphoribosylformylglycinamidine synthase
LAVHLAKVAMGGNLGMKINLAQIPRHDVEREDALLFSESAGRFIVTVDPANREAFEDCFKALAWGCIGTVTAQPDFVVRGVENSVIITVSVADLKAAWNKTFGELI